MEHVCPSIVLTNDWFTGLASAYNKQGYFADYFAGAKFVHIVHNLDDKYQGRIPLDAAINNERVSYLTGLRADLLIDPFWKDPIFNPSRCALECSDQWATVSKSYRAEVKQTSSLAPLLNKFAEPFAFPNGVRSRDVLARLEKLGDAREEKTKLLKKYFNLHYADAARYDSAILFGFVGRICEQKGVHLLLENIDYVLSVTHYNAYFILGGMVDGSEYSTACVNHINELRGKYGRNFWADPHAFFHDGASLNKGADFFLMPSLFEPGGIVQHEALIAGTPVIAYNTGGLKDSIVEFDAAAGTGNGFVFGTHNAFEMGAAISRALGVLAQPAAYKQLRENCRRSFMDVSTVARSWRAEFYRLIEKVS